MENAAPCPKPALTTVARPEAISFKKTYVYPEYARKPNRVVTEENGDVDELEGSTVDLEIQVNQDVSDAKLKIEQGGKSSEVPLTATADSRRPEVASDSDRPISCAEPPAGAEGRCAGGRRRAAEDRVMAGR